MTVHKTQALSIKHDVYGCLEGVFAQGQVYVLISRVTDPQLLRLVGLPPSDLFDDVCAALLTSGVDLEEWLRRAVAVTGDWLLKPAGESLRERVTPRFVSDKMVPVKLRTLADVLNPQPLARGPQLSQMPGLRLRTVLAWIPCLYLCGEARRVFRTSWLDRSSGCGFAGWTATTAFCISVR